MISMKYTEVMSMGFSQALQKLGSAPMHGAKSSQVHSVLRRVDFARTQIMKEYQAEIVEKYAKRDEAGKVVREPSNPNSWEPKEDQLDGMDEESKLFDQRMVELECAPFTPHLVSDITITAQDLKNLGPLYTGNSEPLEGPGVPSNVQSLR